MATAHLVTGVCNSCEALLCIASNEWSEFTPSYSTYDNVDLYSHPGLEQVDQNRPGLKDSELEGCTVRALQCKQCQEKVGVVCVAVAPGKEQYRDRSFLKLEKITLKSVSSGQMVSAKITPRPSSRSGDANGSVSKSDRRRSVTPRNASAEAEILQSEETDIMHIVQRQERDINLVFKTIENLQQEMAAIAETVEEVRMRQDDTAIVPEDIQLLTENVTRVNRKVGELDSLKFEIKLMKQKIKRLEDEKRTSNILPRRGDQAETTRPSILSRPSALNPTRTAADERPQSREHGGMEIDPKLTDPAGPPLQQSGSPISIRTDRIPQEAPQYPDDRNAYASVPRLPGPPRHSSETARQTRNLHYAMSMSRDAQEGDELSDGGEYPSPIPQTDRYNADYIPEADPAEDIYTDDEDDADSGSEEEENYSDDYNPNSREPRGTIVKNGRRYYAHNRAPFAPTGQPLHPTSNSTSTSSKRRRTNSPTPDDEGRGRDPSHPKPSRSKSKSKSKSKSNYRSIWAPEGPIRNERGVMITRDGRIDGRSLRFEGKGHYKRQGPRDAEGYLLRVDGSRDMRSVRIIDAMKKRKAEREARAAAEAVGLQWPPPGTAAAAVGVDGGNGDNNGGATWIAERGGREAEMRMQMGMGEDAVGSVDELVEAHVGGVGGNAAEKGTGVVDDTPNPVV